MNPASSAPATDGKKHRMRAHGWGLFALVSLLWGVPYLFNAIALDDLGPFQIAAARVLVASLVLGPYLMLRRRWQVFRTHGPRLLVLAVIEVVIPFSLIAAGQQTVPSGTTGVLIALEPLFVALLAPVVLAGAPALRATGWLGLLLGMGGVATLLGIDISGPGMLLIAGAALSYGVGALLMGRWSAEVPSLTAASGMILTATPLLVLLALLLEPWRTPSGSTVVALSVLGIACTAGGFASFFALVREAGPTKAALIAHAAPVVALVAGVLLLDEHITAAHVLGTALILAGAGLVMRRESAPPTT